MYKSFAQNEIRSNYCQKFVGKRKNFFRVNLRIISGLDFFLFIDLYKPFQELPTHTKIVIGVKNDDLFEYEVEKVIRPKAALKEIVPKRGFSHRKKPFLVELQANLEKWLLELQ